MPEDSNVEVSFHAIENSKNKYKLSGDLSFVAPLMLNDNGVLFNQTQIGIYNVRDKDRVALNMGFGYRQLSDDENYFTGINSFLTLIAKVILVRVPGWNFKHHYLVLTPISIEGSGNPPIKLGFTKRPS